MEALCEDLGLGEFAGFHPSFQHFLLQPRCNVKQRDGLLLVDDLDIRNHEETAQDGLPCTLAGLLCYVLARHQLGWGS